MDQFPLITSAEGTAGQFTLEETASLTGLPPQVIVRYSETRCVRTIEVDSTGTPCFDEAGILRLRQIEALRLSHGFDLQSLPFVLRLFDRLEAAEQELQMLRELLR